jgi:DNA-binding transcriptional MerR regulator
VARVRASFVEQFAQLNQIATRIGQIGQSIQCELVPFVSDRTQRFAVGRYLRHALDVAGCPRGKVKCEYRHVLTIGQLARYVGVSTKTIRVYHAKKLLAEPERDGAGYRRYTARDAIDLVKIRTLAEAGVPLARINALRAATGGRLARSLRQLDRDLATRIRKLQATRQRLRRLEASHLQRLPPEVVRQLEAMPRVGFSARWVALQTDLWILVFATHPADALELFRDQARAQANLSLRRLFLAYDRAHDLRPLDPAIDELARRIVDTTRKRYGSSDLPGQQVGSAIPALIQASVSAASPAWRRLDLLVRAQLAASHAPASGRATSRRSRKRRGK